MQRNVAKAALARRARGRCAALLAATVLAGSAAAPALAGDRAVANFIGFSPDGRYFAFEEFGIQDGSGFPYSTVYVIDLQQDEWVDGSPVREQGDEDDDLAEVREDALEEAEDLIESLDITHPVETWALIGDGVNEPDAMSLAIGNPDYLNPGTSLDRYTVEIATFDADSPQPCEEYLGAPAKGFALSFGAEGEGKVIYSDTEVLPDSRGCPLTYRLFAVVAPFNSMVPDNAVAIVSSYPFGFEGPDRRFLAVPLDR